MIDTNHPSGRSALGIVHRLFVTLAILAGALAGSLIVAPAHAATGDLICNVAGQLDFTPPLSAMNRSANATDSAAAFGCTSPNGMHSDLKSASATGSGTATSGGDPCSALITVQLKVRVAWSNGKHSGGDITLNTNPSAGTITASGTITNGELAGDTLTFAGAVVPNADCAVNGLSSLSFAGQDIFG